MKTAINSLIETLLPFIDRTKVSDTFLHTIIEDHLAMEKEQIINSVVWFDDTARRPYEIEIDVEQYYNETFKSE